MFTLERLMMMAYMLCIVTGSYMAVSTLKSLYSEARQLEMLASINLDSDTHKVLVFDAIEPAVGGR